MSTFFSKAKIGMGALKSALGVYATYLGFSALTLGPVLPIAAFCVAVFAFSTGIGDIYEGRAALSPRLRGD